MMTRKGFIVQWRHAGAKYWRNLFRGKGNPKDPYKTRGHAEVEARNLESERSFIMTRVRELKKVI